MKIKSKQLRVDKEFDDFTRAIAEDMRRKTGRADISQRRVTAAIPRIPGLKDALMRAEWVDEKKCKRVYYG